jgi:hypothetical protein
MNLRVRLSKLESLRKDTNQYVAITTGIPTSRMPLDTVYFGNEFELVTSTVSEAASRLASRIRSSNKPLLFLVNKNVRHNLNSSTCDGGEIVR